MLIKLKFWHIFKILFSDRHNAFYNLKASQKHAFICASISNKFLFAKLLRDLPKRKIHLQEGKNYSEPYLNAKPQKNVMLIKMKFWLIFKILFSDRDNAFYNLKASQKHAFICASISNKFLFAKIDFGSTNIRSIFNCKNAQNPYLTAKSKKTLC